MNEIRLTPAEMLSREPRKWLMTIAIALVSVILVFWSGSALEANASGGSG